MLSYIASSNDSYKIVSRGLIHGTRLHLGSSLIYVHVYSYSNIYIANLGLSCDSWSCVAVELAQC